MTPTRQASDDEGSANESPGDVADEYFSAIAERDPERLRALFTPSSRLITAAGTYEGVDAIVDFYETTAFAFDDLHPSPGELVVAGGRVAVEIELHMGGSSIRVADFFTVADGRIDRLAVYVLPDGS
jgi:ketosteroid isomerase-like protein